MASTTITVGEQVYDYTVDVVKGYRVLFQHDGYSGR